jgi:hypothetical protein
MKDGALSVILTKAKYLAVGLIVKALSLKQQ